MRARLIWNDLRSNKLMSVATVFFMTVSAAMLSLTALLAASLLGSIEHLMDTAQVPDFMQMHSGVLDERQIKEFAAERPDVQDSQVLRFLNLVNSQIVLGGQNLANSTQDNGLSVQSARFDFMLDMDGKLAVVSPGTVLVPVAYRDMYSLSVGDTMQIGDQTLEIAGFLRDAQMNSMMSSSKRFLVSEEDYDRLKSAGQEEYLIEFLLDEANTDFQSAYTSAGLPSNGPAITRPLIRMINALSDGTLILLILLIAIIVLLISLLCVRFILALQLERDRKELGTLKALGIEKREIRGLYMSKYVLFSALGTALGLLIATVAQQPLSRQLRELYGSSVNGAQAALAGLLGVILAEAIILLFVYCSIRKTDKVSALEALFAAPSPQSAYRKSAFLCAVAAACTFLVVVPINLYNTVSSPTFATHMGIGDAQLRLDIRQSDDIAKQTANTVSMLEKDPLVREFAAFETSIYPVELPNGSHVNLTIEAGDHRVFPVTYSDGTEPAGPNQIALSALNAQELDVSIGDMIEIEIDGAGTQYTVCGIYSDITNGGKTAKIEHVENSAPVIWSILYVRLEGGADQSAWMERYRQTGVDVTDIAAYTQETYAQTLNKLRLAKLLAAGIATMIAFLVLALFTRSNVEKDRMDISLRKALGFTSNSLEKARFGPALLWVLIGALVGFILANLCGGALCALALQSLGATGFQFVIKWPQTLGATATVVGVSALAVYVGETSIRQIQSCECCLGKE